MNILFHICCSNCATSPVQIVREDGHDMTGFWFNPNIHPFEEYRLRLASLQDLADRWRFDLLPGDEYSPGEYFRMFDINVRAVRELDFQGMEIPEGPERPGRCRACYELRLEKTAQEASSRGFEAFSTTLLISPYQDYDQVVASGREIAGRHGLLFFQRDFRPHFRDSENLSRNLGLYRQKYCGCIFSRAEQYRKGQN